MNTVRAAPATKSGNPLSDESLVELTLRVMPPGTSSRNRLATPVTCRRCGMNTVRVALVTKSGNPLSDESLVELTLRVMPPTTEAAKFEILFLDDEVAA